MSNTEHRKVIRLAVVAKDYQTYYVPGKSRIGGIMLSAIVENIEDYECIDTHGNVLSRVDKDCPCLVDYKYINQ